MHQNGKQLDEFKDENENIIFNNFERDKTLIIDDQCCMIHEKDRDHLVVSKKFMKVADELQQNLSVEKQKSLDQFPYPHNQAHFGKLQKVHEELNKPGEQNQLYYIGNFITRLFLSRTLLSP